MSEEPLSVDKLARFLQSLDWWDLWGDDWRDRSQAILDFIFGKGTF